MPLQNLKKSSKTSKNDILEWKTVPMINGRLENKCLKPKSDHKITASIISGEEFCRLKKQAQVVSSEEKMKLIEDIKKQKNLRIQESHERKEEIEKFNQDLRKVAKMSEVEAEARREAAHTVGRAEIFKMDQEEEVKFVNHLIIGKKCQAIRDAQIKEKELIRQRAEEEDKKLDDMMENARLTDLRKEQLESEKQKMEREKFSQQLLIQIKANEIKKLIEAEKIEEECKRNNELQAQLQVEEIQQLAELEKKRKAIREELTKANLEMERMRGLEREEQFQSELKIQEFMKRKIEREAEREKEILLQKKAKEEEITRLRAMQEKQKDRQSQLDEMNAARNQDEIEREWRKKEKAAALKAIDDAEKLKKERRIQIEDQIHMQALEISREKREFERILHKQKEEIAKEKEKNEKIKEAKINYRCSIMQQINEKEKERIKMRKESFEEGMTLSVEQIKKDEKIKEAIRSKLNLLRDQNIPEKYVSDVERRLTVYLGEQHKIK